MARTQAKWAGWSGIVFVVLSLVIVVLAPPFPTLASTPEEIVAYYPLHRLPFLIGNYLAAVAVIPSFLLLGYLVRAVRRAEGEAGWWWIMLLGSAVLAHAVGSVVLMTYQAVAVTATPGNGASAKAMSDLASMGFGYFFITLTAYCLVAGAAFLRTGVVPRWLGSSGVACGVLALIASGGAIVTTGPLAAGGVVTSIAFGAFMLWSLALSIVVMRAPTQPPEPRTS